MKSGNATAILLIIALVVGIASTILILTVARTNPQPTTRATSLLPTTLPATESGQAKFTAPTQTPTSTTPTSSPSATRALSTGDVDVETVLSTDRTTLAVDFITVSFTTINTITYTITYTADVSGVATTKNIQGSFSPATVLVTGYKTTGYPYIRKTFTLGTCSGTTCTYDTNPRSFAVTATAT